MRKIFRHLPTAAKIEEYEKEFRERMPELSDETASKILAVLAEVPDEKIGGAKTSSYGLNEGG